MFVQGDKISGKQMKAYMRQNIYFKYQNHGERLYDFDIQDEDVFVFTNESGADFEGKYFIVIKFTEP